MNSAVSTNTQAILLLTAPLIPARNGTTELELLTPGEYRRLARQLRELGHAPADLLGVRADDLLRELDGGVPADRVRRLLDRGFLVTQAIEHWHARAIWVVGRDDPDYPVQLKDRLNEDSPAVLYGCGDRRLLEDGGLAIVGSRHVDGALIAYAEAVGRQCAEAKKRVISGGAQGIDRAAMRGALEVGGQAAGVLADSLERAALNRDNRNSLLDEQLVLISPYDPSAGFNVGHAMQRNKLIYALADAALVVSADFEKGGTWAGATEQLQKLRFVPVYVRSSGELGRGLETLARMGARPWPNPQAADEFLAVFGQPPAAPDEQQPQLAFQSATADAAHRDGEPDNVSEPATSEESLPAVQTTEETSATMSNGETTSNPADTLLACVRDLLIELLATPKSETEVASALQVSTAQAKSWLQRLVEEGILEKRTKPVRFVVKQKMLL